MPGKDGLTSKGSFPKIHQAGVTFPPSCYTQRNGEGSDQEQAVARLQPQSYLQGFLYVCVCPVFPEGGDKRRQISWEMNQCCLLPKGFAAFAARVVVSAPSCHYTCPSLPCISALHPALGNCCMTWGGVEKIPKPI